MCQPRVSTGVPKLDVILRGGLVPGRAYLARGGPGTGKTTLGFHFLAAGAAIQERVLLISMGESEAQLKSNAGALGFELSSVSILDLSPTSRTFAANESYDIFSPDEVEHEPLTRQIVERIEAVRPQRVFLDSMTQLRYLSADAFQFRKRTLSLLRFMLERGATVLFTSEAGSDTPDDDLCFLADGIIEFEYKDDQRTLRVNKLRGSGFVRGHHDLRLTSSGIDVFPSLVPSGRTREFVLETLSSGIAELDQLLHGGLERETTSIISGPSGVGKTTLGLLFMAEAARRGERAVIYSFEEARSILLARAAKLGLYLDDLIEQGTLAMQKVEPLQYTPDEFAHIVLGDVEERGSRIVMLDGVAGYRLSIQRGALADHLHTLARHLTNRGVTLLVLNETEAITGDFRATEVGISYLADNIIFLRYLEMHGEIRRAIGVLKKRLSSFEKTLRDFEITGDGIKVGAPITNLRGILGGRLVQDEPDHRPGQQTKE